MVAFSKDSPFIFTKDKSTKRSLEVKEHVKQCSALTRPMLYIVFGRAKAKRQSIQEQYNPPFSKHIC